MPSHALAPENTHIFEHKVETALAAARKVLDNTRSAPAVASKTPHAYDDKFALAENITGTAAASWFGCFEALGLREGDKSRLAAVAAAGQHRLTLRLSSTTTCKFERKATREEVSDAKLVSSSTVFGTRSTSVVTTITEHFWTLSHSFELRIFAGASEDLEEPAPCALAKRVARREIVTRSDSPPRPSRATPPPIDTDVTWLFGLLSPSTPSAAPSHQGVRFAIDREQPSCVSPRRNADAERAEAAAQELAAWARKVDGIFENVAQLANLGDRATSTERPDLRTVRAPIFVAGLPLMLPRADGEAGEAPQGGGEAEGGGEGERGDEGGDGGHSVALRADDTSRLLAEERRALGERLEALGASFPAATDASSLLSCGEAALGAVAAHVGRVAELLREGLAYIEGLLRQQLVAAIGKELTAADFAKYMRCHDQKLFAGRYAPQPFCFAVRQPERSPEGTLSIDVCGAGGAPDEPIATLVRKIEGPAPPMSFALDAATKVTFTGERYLHAYMAHAFCGRRPPALQLTVRARQFSCFMLLLGRMGPAGTFQPSHAMVVRNKDEVLIPLLLEQLPSAKAFRDAISSISPEQQRFARAYRSMQLEGSVFGVLLVQLKPQLEKLLRLPADALTKEIKLTERLLELFINYQIPSDLLAYDGDDSAPAVQKLDAVRAHTQAIYDTLEESKKAEVDAARQEHAYAHPGALSREEESGESDEDDDDGGGGGGGGGGKGGGGGGKKGKKFPMRMARCNPPPPPPPPMVCQSSAMACASSAIACASSAAPRMKMRAAVTPAPAPAAPQLPQLPPPPSGEDRGHIVEREGAAAATESQAHTADGADGAESVIDYTRLPAQLDARFESLDLDAALKPTTISIGPTWAKSSQKALLGQPTKSSLRVAEQKGEKQRAFDLLDALSRSGTLPIECASLHVLIASTHCFDESLIDTVVARNINPIEKLERSALIIAETIQGVPAPELINASEYERVRNYAAPALLPQREGSE